MKEWYLKIKQNEIMQKIAKLYNKIYFIIEFIMSIFFSTALYQVIYYKKYFDFYNRKYLIIMSILLIILIAIVIKAILRNRKKLEKLFLTLMIPIGMMYLIFLIPHFVPDEAEHIYRAYNISQGNIIMDFDVQRDIVPEDMKNIEYIKNYYDLKDYINSTSDYNNTTEVINVFNTYSPTVYLVQSIAFFIGKIFSLNIMIAIYLARILNFLLFLVLGYYTIKIIPMGKLVTMVYLFNPMMIHQAVSVSADVFINAFALIFIAYFMKLRFKENEITRKEKILFFVFAFGICFTKHVYMPLIFMSVALLFTKGFKNKRNKGFIISTIIIMVVIAGAWFIFGSQYRDDRQIIKDMNVNSSEQVKYIISNPVDYIKTVFKTMYERNSVYLNQFVGGHLGRLEIETGYISTVAYIVLLVISPFLEKSELELERKEKIWYTLIVIGIYFIILTGLYMGWTAIGKNIIEGVQGRYFIPILIIPLLCLIKKNKYIEFKNANIWISLFIIIINSNMLNAVIKYLS